MTEDQHPEQKVLANQRKQEAKEHWDKAMKELGSVNVATTPTSVGEKLSPVGNERRAKN